MSNTIFVQSNRDDDRVVISENHPLHPDGDLFVAGKTRNKLDKNGRAVLKNGVPVQEANVVEAGLSPRVIKALNDRQLVEVKKSSKAASSKVAAPAPAKATAGKSNK